MFTEFSTNRGLKRPSEYETTCTDEDINRKRKNTERLYRAIVNRNFWNSDAEPVTFDFLDFVLDIPFGIPTEDTRHVALWTGTREEFHPFILCPTCNNTLYTSNWKNGNGFSWRCKDCKGTNIWDNDAKQVIAKLRHARYMKPDICGFFSPSRIRFFETKSFPLINHVPTEMVDEEEWLWMENAVQLASSKEREEFYFKTEHVHVSRHLVKSWSQFSEPKPIASTVNALPMSPYTTDTIQKWVSCVLNSSPDLVLMNENMITHPLVSCDSTSDDSSRMVRLMKSFNPKNGLLVLGGNIHNTIFDHFDVKIHLRSSSHYVKIWSPWMVHPDTPVFFIPLHGMGSDDLGWLMGNGISDWIMLQVDDVVITVCMALFRHAISIFVDGLGTCSPILDLHGIEANRLRTQISMDNKCSSELETRNVVYAFSDIIGRERSSVVQKLARRPTSFSVEVPPNLIAKSAHFDHHKENNIVTIDDMRHVCHHSYDATRFSECVDDRDRHRITTTYCGPACHSNTEALDFMKRTHGCIDGDQTILSDGKTDREDTSLWPYIQGQPRIVSLSDFRSSDVYLTMSPKYLFDFLTENSCVVHD